MNRQYRHKLWRIPQQGKLRGVCAGIADYLDIPVTLVRIMVVLSLFLGLFMFTLLAYLILGFVLDVKPDNIEESHHQPTTAEQLITLDQSLMGDEQRIRALESYVTSESFSVRSRFRQL